MKILNILNEVMNQPYPFKLIRNNNHEKVYSFEALDGTRVKVEFHFDEDVPDDDSWDVSFYRNVESDVTDYKDKITGQGDAYRIYATIFSILENFTKSANPEIIAFSADNETPSRVDLYNRMIKMFASRYGYRLKSRNDQGVFNFTEYELERVR